MPSDKITDVDFKVHVAFNGQTREDLIVTSIHVRERMSAITEMTIEVIHDSSDELDPSEFLGEQVSVSFNYLKTTTPIITDDDGNETFRASPKVEDNPIRSFFAVPIRLQKKYGDPQHERWVMELASPLWKLTRGSHCRAFLDLKASDIITSVLEEYGITCDVADTTQMRPYCVQYNETDFQFISRLLEEEGLFYYDFKGMPTFTQIEDETTWSHNLSQSPQDVKAAKDISAYFDLGEIEVIPESDGLNMIQGWNYECSLPLEKVIEGDFNYLNAENVSREAQSNFTKKLGTVYEYQYVGQSMLQGDSAPDYATRRIEESEVQAQVMVGTATHPMFAPHNQFTANLDKLEAHPSGFNTSAVIIAVDHVFSGEKYSNTFHCIPSDVAYRPPRTTRKPRIYGTQIGVVATADDGVATTDPDGLGRVQVIFPWMEDGAGAPFWIRVAQAVAGPGFGSWATPRGGQEVIVTFENGDPDRPLIIGALYNGVNTPPYSLPSEDTKTGIVTRSAPGNDAAKYNEVTIDDNDGAEKIFVRAERDLEFKVVNQDFTRTIDLGNEVVTITEGDQTTTLDKGNQETTLTEGNQSTTLDQGNVTLDVGGTLDHTVTGAITIESSDSITLKVGGNSIEITSSGVTVTGTEVTVDGSAQTTIKGGVVQIN